MTITIHINNLPLQVEQGITLLQAARQNQIDIPTLCDFPGLPAHGSCRMCVVEIQGRPNMPTACTTPVEAGMQVYTHSPKVVALRVELLQMLLSEHPSGCLFCPENTRCDECMVTLRKAAVTTGCSSCPKDEQCALQTLVEEYQVDKPGYPMRYRMLPVERNDPFFDRDYNLCILCGRCIRVCEDLHFTGTLAFTQRGTHAVVGTSFYHNHLESDCTFCGSCVEVCPTGALSEKTRKWDGKPEREVASTCSLCGIGCQINLLAKKERVIGSLPNHNAGEEALCVKGRFGITELVNHPTRLKHPQKRSEHTWLGTSWEDAIQTAAEKLSACPPERFEMRISASCANEDLFVAAKFTRQVMNSANIRSTALSGYGAGIASIARLLQQSKALRTVREASSVLCLGLEDKYAQSVVEVELHRARQQGVKIVALGAHSLPWSSYMDAWLQYKPGQEAALLQELLELTGADAAAAEEAQPLAHAANILRQPGRPVILLGPSALTDQHVLEMVEALIHSLHADVIVLPEQANLAGALWQGLLPGSSSGQEQALDVLYLIGETIPSQSSGQPFTIHQNLYPLPAEAAVDLMLPAAAFTEVEGTFLNADRRMRAIHPAVQPPGEALPNWLILSRLAQAMGAPGFEYHCVEDVQAEMSGMAEGMTFRTAVVEPALEIAPGQLDAMQYMGYPLAQWVEGLRTLYPHQTRGGQPK
jgi:predicted molibdopterin-dependent oxidoreductase YjgC